MILHAIRYPRESPTESVTNRVGPKLVLLHGMGGTGALWRAVTASLEADCDLLCPDQRGHGQSRTPDDETRFGPLDYAADLQETCDHLGFKPAWVIGHSMGVRTACGYAKLSPRSVSGLILVDLGFSGVVGGGIGEGLATFLTDLPDSFPSRTLARDFLELRSPDPSIAQYLLAVAQTDRSTGVISFPFSRSALLKTLESSRKGATGEWMAEYARTTSRPVIILRGSESRVYQKAEFEADRIKYANQGNIQFIEFAGAGHGLPFEKRAEFVNCIREWVGIRPAITE